MKKIIISLLFSCTLASAATYKPIIANKISTATNDAEIKAYLLSIGIGTNNAAPSVQQIQALGFSTNPILGVAIFGTNGTWSIVPTTNGIAYVLGFTNRQFINPSALFSWTTNNYTVTFSNSSVGPNGSITNNQWSFGDGTGTNIASPVHNYTNYGSYSVSLAVWDNLGYSNSLTQTVVLQSTNAPVTSNVVYAANASWAAVNAAYTLATNGQTVIIPAGTANWSNTLVMSKGVNLLGPGTNLLTIYDTCTNREVGGNLIYLLNIYGGNCGWKNATYVSGIRFISGGVPINGYNQARMIVSSPDGGSATALPTNAPVVFIRCSFENFLDNAIGYYGGVSGLVRDCSFFMAEHAIRVQSQLGIAGNFSSDSGDIYYAMPPQYGTTNQVVFEHNYYTNTSGFGTGGAVCDFEAGANITLRYNTLQNTFASNHGIDSSISRSGRILECYNNTFAASDAAWNTLYPTTLRGGSGVIYSNTIIGYASGTVLTCQSYRNTMYNVSPFLGANGANPWDSNDVISLTYTMTNAIAIQNGITNTTGTNWTTNAWVGYIASTLGSTYVYPAGNFPATTNRLYAIIGANDGLTATFAQAKNDGVYYQYTGGPNNETVSTLWYGNQVIQFRKSLAQIDQVGWVGGDSIVRMFPSTFPSNTVTGSYSWPHETLEPVYVYSNIVNGVLKNNVGLVPNVRLGQEVITNSFKPGYVPLVYPHPLAN